MKNPCASLDAATCRAMRGGEPNWILYQADSQVGIDLIAGRTDSIIRNASGGRVEHDVRWARWQVDNPQKRLNCYLYEDGGAVRAYVPVFVHNSAIGYRLGDLALFSLAVRRFVIRGSPLTVPGAETLAEEFLVWLRRTLQPREVVFLEAVREGSALHRALSNPQSRLREAYCVVPNGPLYQHRSIAFTGGYDDYLASLGAKTRADLKRTRRRFVDAVNGDFTVRCFTRPEQLEEFTAQAMEVSSKTWQFNWMGGGLRHRDALLAHFEQTARLGWFRSYILSVRGQPIAFQVGQIYNRTFYAREIGYDPQWRKLQAGIFLHTEIVADLLSVPGLASGWDFGNTDTLHKQRLSNRSEPAGFFYLVQRTAGGIALSRSLNLMNALSGCLGRALNSFAMRGRLRRLLRSSGAAR